MFLSMLLNYYNSIRFLHNQPALRIHGYIVSVIYTMPYNCFIYIIESNSLCAPQPYECAMIVQISQASATRWSFLMFWVRVFVSRGPIANPPVDFTWCEELYEGLLKRTFRPFSKILYIPINKHNSLQHVPHFEIKIRIITMNSYIALFFEVTQSDILILTVILKQIKYIIYI